MVKLLRKTWNYVNTVVTYILCMVRSVVIGFPELEIELEAGLQELDEPELCEVLWKNLEQPVNMVCRHPVSSGEEFSAEARPPRHPVKSGMGVGRRKWLYTTVPLGGVIYAVTGGFGGLSLYYGKCTEPLQIRGSLVALVSSDQHTEMKRAGKAVWDSQAFRHKPVVINVRRGRE